MVCDICTLPVGREMSMAWIDVPFSLSAAGLVAWVGKTMFASLRFGEQEIPLEGHLFACDKYLRANDYEVTGTKENAGWEMDISQLSHREKMVVDFIARKDGIYYAVKVRTAKDDQLDVQALLSSFHTLCFLSGVEHLLYVDVETEEVQHIPVHTYFCKRVLRRKMIYRGLWFAGGLLTAVAWMHKT
jgi:hypothetical protein